jgi:hypothetical protein
MLPTSIARLDTQREHGESEMGANIGPVLKAIAGGLAAGATTGATTVVIAPPGSPWWGQLIASIASALIAALVVYHVPNKGA